MRERDVAAGLPDIGPGQPHRPLPCAFTNYPHYGYCTRVIDNHSVKLERRGLMRESNGATGRRSLWGGEANRTLPAPFLDDPHYVHCADAINEERVELIERSLM